MQGIKNAARLAFIFIFGGICYGLMEVIFRGRTHYSMFIAGGICFSLIILLDNRFGGRISLFTLSLLGSAVITAVEFIFGVIFNIWLGMTVWDYSSAPFNLLGQVCLPFSLLWIIVSAAAILLNRFVLSRAFSRKSQGVNAKKCKNF